MKKIFCLSVFLILEFFFVCFEISAETGTVTDIDGNTYKTVKIGDQWWMAENLRTKHFRDGTGITIYPDSFHNTSGQVVTGGSNYDYCVHYTYPNKDSANVATYGLNYTWSAAFSSKEICPIGWSIPDTSDWFNLAKIVTADKGVGAYSDAGYSEVGKYLKSDSLWSYSSSSLANDNAYGLNIVPSGEFDSNGYNYFGQRARFWTKYEVCAGMYGRYFMDFEHDTNEMILGGFRNNNTICVRCIKSALSKLADEQSSDGGVSVYPTCTSGQLFIKCNDTYAWVLYNMSGMAMCSGKNTSSLTEINVGSLPVGVYLLSIQTNKKMEQVKIIKK